MATKKRKLKLKKYESIRNAVPVIGVMPLADEEKDSLWMLPQYMDMLERSGAVPIMLPLTDNLDTLDACLKLCDGFLLTGGHDVDPSLYGIARKETCGNSNPVRDFMDTYVLQYAIENDLPLLGICRGIQLMNASEGGTLYQDLESEMENCLDHHMSAPYNRSVHSVSIDPQSRLYQITGEREVSVNSYHHQGICQPAPGYRIAARSEDGLIEAIERKNSRFIIGVQWHPEHLYAEKSYPHGKKLIDAFTQAAAAGKETGESAAGTRKYRLFLK